MELTHSKIYRSYFNAVDYDPSHTKNYDKHVIIYKQLVYHILQSAPSNTTELLHIVFFLLFSPLISRLKREDDLDSYGKLEPNLYHQYVNLFDSSEWFKSTISYFLEVSSDISLPTRTQLSQNYIANFKQDRIRRLLFLYKGPCKLANYDVFHDYIHGLPSYIDSCPTKTVIHLLFLDAVPSLNINHPDIFIYSLKDIPSTSQKLLFYYQLTSKFTFYNIIWVSSPQHIGIYLSTKRALHQTYWSMRRFSIILPSIDLYATVFSMYSNSIVNGKFWYGGRCRLSVRKTSFTSKQEARECYSLYKHFHSLSIDHLDEYILLGSIARRQKYYDPSYFNLILSTLSLHEHAIFIYATMESPVIDSIIRNFPLQIRRRIHNVGWLDGNSINLSLCFDLFVDTYPFGCGLTAAEGVSNNVPLATCITDLNKESSFCSLLCNTVLTNPKFKALNCSPNNLIPVGCASSYSDYTRLVSSLVSSSSLRHSLASIQKLVFDEILHDGENFTSDYTNYFLSLIK